MIKEHIFEEKEYMDTQTGEVVKAKTVGLLEDKEEQTKDSDFFKGFDGLFGQFKKLTEAQQDIIEYMMMNSNEKTNCFYGNQKELAKKFQVSRQTTNGAIQSAIALDLLVKKNNHEYMINPSLFARCTRQKRMYFVKEYLALKVEKRSLKAIENELKALEKEIYKEMVATNKRLDTYLEIAQEFSKLKKIDQNKKDSD